MQVPLVGGLAPPGRHVGQLHLLRGAPVDAQRGDVALEAAPGGLAPPGGHQAAVAAEGEGGTTPGQADGDHGLSEGEQRQKL